MSPVATYCSSCGRLVASSPCPRCKKAKERVRNARPEQRVWTSPGFRRARRAALARDGYACRECGSRDDLTVHHVVALRDGGHPTALTNLLTLCRRCHGSLPRGLEGSRGRASPP
jgi:5-methylcytosine-specific restriction endonuclease McrA